MDDGEREFRLRAAAVGVLGLVALACAVAICWLAVVSRDIPAPLAALGGAALGAVLAAARAKG